MFNKRVRGAGYGIQSLGWTGNGLLQWAPGAAASGGQGLGMTFAEPGGANASTVPALAATFREQLPRMRFATTASANSYAGTISEDPICIRGASSGQGGFHFGARFGLSADVADETKVFVGLCASSTSMVSGTTPGDVTHTLGVGFDAADGAWQVIRAADGASTKLAVPGGARNTTYVFDLSIVAAPHAETAFLWLIELTTGAILVDGLELESPLPAPNGDLYAHAEIGIEGAGAAAGLEVISMFVETPDAQTAWSSVLVENGFANVRDFGAVGDGITDDSDAFEIALRLLGSGTLYVPPGRYKLTRSLVIDCSPALSEAGEGGARHILLRGAAPGSDSEGVSRLEFGEYAGIRVVGSVTFAGETGTGQMVAIEDLDIIGGHGEGSGKRPPEHAVWEVTTEYAGAATTGTVGDYVLVPGPRSTNSGASFEYYYENVNTTETSGDTSPGFASVTRVDPSALWQSAQAYWYGAVVRVAGRFDVFFECITPGTSGAGPMWTYDVGDVVNDGGTLQWKVRDASAYFAADGGTLETPTGPVWACRVAAGIYSVARLTVLRVAIRDFLNAGIHLQGPAQPPLINDANGSSAYDVRIARCGAGIVCREAVATCAFMGAQIRLYDTDDGFTEEECDRVIGISENTSPGSSFFGCHVTSCEGPSVLVSDATTAAAFFGCTTNEGTGPASVPALKASVWGGSWGSGFTSASSFHGAPANDDWRNVAVKGTGADIGGDVTLRARLGASDERVWGFSADGETPFGVEYGTTQAGWWTLARAADPVLAWSGTNADENGAQTWAPRGVFIGDPKRLLKTAPTAAPPGGNGWRKGDIVLNRTVAAGTPMYWQCIDTGPPSQWWPDPDLL